MNWPTSSHGGSVSATKKMGKNKRNFSRPTESFILVLLQDHSAFLEKFLRSKRYVVATANSAEHAVALCAANPVEAIVLDQCWLVKADGWSVAQSIKLVKPRVPVVLFCHDPLPGSVQLPAGVDFLVSDRDVQQLALTLRKCLNRAVGVKRLG
ncbi:MAG TPA: response regulator [Terriglobales bacterium]|nr:response regulator [Terriglobales bacterium]